jgi:hypothetical protein
MKSAYLIAMAVLALGIVLLGFGTSSGEGVDLLGLTVHSRVVRGAGIIAIILSLIAFMAAYGSSLPSTRVGRRH